jgi:cation diffusion facilitator family transporter
MSAKSRAAALSVASNTSLLVLKLVVGLLSGSVSIVSEAIHSGNDLLAAAIAWVSVRKADVEADPGHPYGHGKIEAVSGAVEALLIIAAAIWILVEAVRRIVHGGAIEHLGAGTAVMGVSVVVNAMVSRHLFRVARREDSLAIEADAHHLSADVYTSLGVGAGLAVVWSWRTWTGGSSALDVIDPLAGILVALFIMKIGVGLTKNAVGHLLDQRLPDEEQAVIRSILDRHPSVREWHGLRTRKSGSRRQVDVHITLPGHLTLSAGHAAAKDIEELVRAALPSAHAVIHVDPLDALPPERRPAAAGAAATPHQEDL